jgi:hypothetical protein
MRIIPQEGFRGDEQFSTVGKRTTDKKVSCSLAVKISRSDKAHVIEIKGSGLAGV